MVYPGDASALTLHAAANPYAEAAFAAQTLQSWHERGIPWQYMAVALADAQSMAGILAVTLQSAGIPCYQARKDKNWAESDRIRDILKDMGIAVKDNKEGVQWMRV